MKTNDGQNAHCFGRELQQSMLTGLAVSGLISKLQTPSDESRLMGEPPYHLRKSRSVLALAVFAIKTQLLASLSSRFWLQKNSEECPLGVSLKREKREKKFV